MSAMRSSSERAYLFRGGLVLICSHWEGFLKRAIHKYSEHVFAQQLRIRDLAPVFVAQALYSDVRKAGAADFPGSRGTHIQLAMRIQKGLDVVCTHAEWNADTGGNPGSSLVANLLASVGLSTELGLDVAMWSTTKVFIDELVVAERNRIAHGEYLQVTREQFLERSERMLVLLDRLSDEILTAAKLYAYRAENQPS
jgi:hypothetical protein